MGRQQRETSGERRQHTMAYGNVQASEIVLVFVLAGVDAALQATHMHNLILILKAIGFLATALLLGVAVRSLMRPPRYGLIHWAYILVGAIALVFLISVS